MLLRSALLAATALVASTPALSTTIAFTNNAKGSAVPTGQYAASGLTLNNTFYYIDARDTFDGQGIFFNQNTPGSLVFSSPVNNLSIDLLDAVTATNVFSVFNSSNALLETYAYLTTGSAANTTHNFTSANIARVSVTTTVTGSFGLSTVRYDVAATPAVPEPATWAMMLVGFGAMGVAMRRRAKVSAVRFA